MKLFLQSFVVIISTLIVFLIVNTEFNEYTVYVLGLLLIMGIINVLIKKLTNKSELFTGSNLEMLFLTIVVLLIIFLTGGIASPIFFLLYFLLFGISFMFEPVIIFVMLSSVLILFAQDALNNDPYANILKLLSLLLLSPLAFFFGNEYKKREQKNLKEKEKAK